MREQGETAEARRGGDRAIPWHAWVGTHGRYVMPSFTERKAFGVRELDPYSRLFEDRIIFLGTQIDDASANDMMAQLITLEALDPDRDISVYINSPGGSLTALMAIYDTMRFVRPHIETTCIGQAGSAAAVLLAAGTPGKRAALPNSRILLHEPSVDGGYGQFSDLEIQAREILRNRKLLETIIATHTGTPEEQIRRDLERDMVLTPELAKQYGLIDEIITTRKRRPANSR